MDLESIIENRLLGESQLVGFRLRNSDNFATRQARDGWLSMMNRKKLLYARAGATAIAAVLALSSTSVLAQDAQPAQPAPTMSDSPATAPAPATTTEVAPAATDSSATAVDSTATTPTPVSNHKATKVSRSTTLKRTVQVAAAKPAPVTTRTVSKTTETREPAKTAATKPASSPGTTAAAAPPAQTSQSQVTPIVDVNNAPVKTAQAKPMKKKDDAPIIAAGSALAFLAIGGAAVGLSRRKREDEEMMQDEAMVDEPGAEAEPAVRDPIFEEEPPMIAPEVAAFGWADRPRTADGVDGRSGETWVERAYRGPSPDNPSLSLRKRLKRAAFFDKRDREVAAGEAQRVDADAGLPDSLPTRSELELA